MPGSYLIIGQPGSGKTTLAATAGTPSEPVAFLDMDNKLHKMVNLREKLANGSIIQLAVDDPLSTIGIRRLAGEKHQQGGKLVTQRPKGYMHLVDHIEALEKSKCVINGKKVKVCLDSYTTVMEHIKRLILAVNDKSTMTQPLYGSLLTNFEELNNTLLRMPTDVIFIAHEDPMKDELTGEITYGPLIEGQMKKKIMKDFEEVYWCKKEVKMGKVEYYLDPIGATNRMARTSRNLTSNKIEPDLSKIMKMGG
jgi:hypothetical protein